MSKPDSHKYLCHSEKISRFVIPVGINGIVFKRSGRFPNPKLQGMMKNGFALNAVRE